MNQLPLVTIKCVAYNEAPYIRRTLDGFVNQKTNFPFVAIVHDDASTDGTDDVIRQYAERYPDIIKPFFEEPGNNLFSKHKLDAEVNKLVFQTGCKYVAMCEGDDFWIDEGKLQMQVDYMEAHSECVLCYTDCHVANENGEISTHSLLSQHLLIPKNFEEHLMNAGYIAPPTWVYRADASMRIGSYDEYTDDTFAMALDLFQQGEVHYLDVPTAVYTVRQGSVTTQQDTGKHWNYVKGIGQTQFFMANKYGCAEELKERLRQQLYMTDMLLAIEAGDTEFVKSAIQYFEKKGMVAKWFVERCKDYVRYKKQYQQISQSKAYRLGKSMLKPFKWMCGR